VKFVLGKKQEMTQFFDQDGNVHPATLIVVDGEHEFEEGDVVRVSGVSKGKGFQGVVKRHGFHGGPRTHGQKHSEREPGSIGATGPQRIFKGKKMAGRMGGNRVTLKNLKILKVDKENNQLLISGAVPGRKGTLLEIRTT
jgi:large subunit ribosomal protein L3